MRAKIVLWWRWQELCGKDAGWVQRPQDRSPRGSQALLGQTGGGSSWRWGGIWEWCWGLGDGLRSHECRRGRTIVRWVLRQCWRKDRSLTNHQHAEWKPVSPVDLSEGHPHYHSTTTFLIILLYYPYKNSAPTVDLL
jgi:hypothetical protein